MADLPLIDSEVLENLRSLGTGDFLERLIELFLDTSVKTVHDAVAAAHVGNGAQAAFDAHNLRSSAGNLGLLALAEATHQVENFRTADTATMAARTDEMRRVYDKTVVELVAILDRLREASRVS